ncbi:MAG: D-aminoacyl-tRNA deacylase [Candidatus Thorarchaeota archaeon]
MNIRDKFLDSNFFRFEESAYAWHNNSLFKIEGFSSEERNADFKEHEIYLGLTKEPLIFLNDLKLIETEIRPDFLIFASRHSSKTERPAFLIHTTGNWGENTDFGGNSKDLSLTSALLHKAGFLSLINQYTLENLANFSIDIEVSHHGPTILEKPLIFMELGSNKKEWVINEAGEFLAISILKTIFKFIELDESQNQQVGIGFGGTHYAPNFNRLIKTKDVAISFICPKYNVQDLDYELVKKMIDNTSEEVDYFIIDWKGTNSEDKKHLIPLLDQFDIPIKKTKEF